MAATIFFFTRHLTSIYCIFLCVGLASYSTLGAQCNNNTVINISGPATTTWTAPQTGGPFFVQITATGGGGGPITQIFFNNGGNGATMSGVFVVQNGETIRAIAGDFGKFATLEGAGAGGGSGAVNCGNPSDCVNGEILIIAAGGNGGDQFVGLGGSAATNGNGNGGLAGGDPLHEPDWGGGGGALNSGGQNSIGSGGQGGGQVFRTGLSAGGEGSRTQVPNDGGAGMGGGGGGGDYGAGGGGGHTGGNGGNNSEASSFNSGADQVNTDGANGGGANPGSVVVVCLGPLPIELVNFKAVILASHIGLHWSTATEKNNLGFEVERSADGTNWHTLDFVPGSGTSYAKNEYSFSDHSPFPGVNYYRLKQIDHDGAFEYSPMVVADMRTDDLQFNVFPNPSTDGLLTLRVVSSQEGDGLLEIFDWAGYKVYREPVQLLKGTMVYPVSMTTFPKGTYTTRLELPDGSMFFRKIVIQ